MSSLMSTALIPYTPPQTTLEFIRSVAESYFGPKGIPALVLHPIAPSPFVIFLDIDGVVYNCPNQKDVYKKVAELFPDIETWYDNRVCSIAASYFFDKGALTNLSFLIKEIEKTRSVWIVISSSWRENRTVEELKETFFGIHDFSKYIVDKTPDKISKNEIGAYCSSEIHKGSNSQCRAAEINYWLKQNPEVNSYIVLDDIDNHLLTNFGERFFQICCNTLLTQEICQEILLQNS